MGNAGRPVAARISAAVLSQLSSFRLATTTSAPASANPRHTARAMPRRPPVTTATRPERSKSSAGDGTGTSFRVDLRGRRPYPAASRTHQGVDGMGEARAEITINRSADDVWETVGNFGDVTWMPGVERSELDGDDRIVETVGMRLVEHQYSRDDEARTLTYGICATHTHRGPAPEHT